MNNNQEERLLDLFGKHMIALCVTYRLASDDPSAPLRIYTCPGVVLSVREHHFFISAGHCLAEIRDTLANPQFQMARSVLTDSFGIDRISNVPIPFDITDHSISAYDRQGLDFGLIYLREHYITQIKANGIVIIDQQHWISQIDLEFSHYQMLGLPAELCESTLTSAGDALFRTALLNVRKLQAPPEGVEPTQYPQFIGEVSENIPLTSLRGMSGGPIFGFRVGEQIQYWVVALQSSWLPRRRIVFATYMPLVAAVVTDVVTEIESGLVR